MFAKKSTVFSKFSFGTIVFEQCLKNKTFEMSRLAEGTNVLPPKQDCTAFQQQVFLATVIEIATQYYM